MNKIFKSIFITSLLLCNITLFAKGKTTSPVYNTFEYLVGEFKADIKDLSKKIANSVLLKVSVEGDIDKTFRKHVRRTLESIKTKNSKFRFRQCKACVALRAETIGNQIGQPY